MGFSELRGKRVLITGASTGIGAAVARRFGELGARVGVHCNASREEAETVAADIRDAGGEAHLLAADVTDPDAAADVVDRFAEVCGGLDVLINNAGGLVGGRTAMETVDDARFERLLDLNARSVFVASRTAVPLLRRQGGGSIIHTSSVAARNGGGGGVGVYAATKGFVSTLTRAQAREYAADGIRVNAVAPGVILTRFHERNSTEEQLETARRGIPMGRLGTAEDCVGAYLFLATEALSGYITGQVIEVNGGQVMP